MATIVTRSGKGSPLTNTEVDSNFTNLNTDKLESTITVDVSIDGDLTFPNNHKIAFGDAGDLTIHHESTDSIIRDTTGHRLWLQTDNNIYLSKKNATEFYAIFYADAGVELRHNNIKKFETTSTGVEINGGATFSGHLTLGDNHVLKLGASEDLQLFHNTANSGITNNTGSLLITNNADDEDVVIFSDNGSGGTALYFKADGGTGESLLYHYGSSKLATKTDGVAITGDITAKTNDGAILKLQTSDTSVADGDSIGAIEFSAPDEASGTDAITTAASIVAEADATVFSSSDNRTDLVFKLGESGAATERMRLEHEGSLELIGYDTDANPDPSLKLFRNSASPADDDQLGAIYFAGNNSASETTGEFFVYGFIGSQTVDVTDGTEDGRLIFRVAENGTPAWDSSANTLITLTPDTIAFDASSGTTFGGHDISDVGNLTIEGGVFSLKNSGSQSQLRLYCESNNAHYVALQAPAHADFSGNVTVTLPSTDGIILSTSNSDAPTTTTSSGDADFVLVDDGGVMKKITPANLGIGSGTSGITVQDEGSSLSTAGTTLNFVGAGVIASGTGATKTITIAGGSDGVTVQDEGSALSTTGTTLNFVGAGVTASGTGSTKTITISGGGSGGALTDETWGASLDSDSANDSKLFFKNDRFNIIMDTGSSVYEPAPDLDGTGTQAVNNVFIGNNAGKTATTADESVIIGAGAGQSVTTGYDNTFIGARAGDNITTGFRNTFIGYEAGDGVPADHRLATYVGYRAGFLAVGGGQQNITAVGYEAGYRARANSTAIGHMAGSQRYYSSGGALETTSVGSVAGGNYYSYYRSYDVDVGYQAGHTNRQGDYSTHIGWFADGLATDTDYAVVVGADAKSAGWSVSIGYQSQDSGSSSSYNMVSIGHQAAYDMDGGDNSVFIGFQAGYAGGTGNNNVGIGFRTLYDLDSGANNSALGYQSLYEITGGDNNTAIGYQAGKNITTAENNVFIGYNAGLGASNPANANTGVGYESLKAITGGGAGNTGFGYNSLLNVTTGDYNTSLGHHCADGVSTASYNIAVGHYANCGNSDNNIAMGFYAKAYSGSISIGYEAAKDSGSQGQSNVSIGFRAGQEVSGDRNVFIGGNAGRGGGSSQSSNGDNNVGIGDGALLNLSNGEDNAAIGNSALSSITSADKVVGIGRQAGTGAQTTSNSVYIGYQATSPNGASLAVAIGSQPRACKWGVSIGTQAGGDTFSSNTSTFNVLIGYRAGYEITGDDNTGIGPYALYNDSTSTAYSGDNLTCIGYKAIPSAIGVSNEITLGNSSVATLRCQVTSITALSDQRDKTDIEDLDLGLKFVNAMKPRKFTWNRRDGKWVGKKELGFIAQELHELEMDFSSTERTRLVNYENPSRLEAQPMNTYPILVKAIQELSAKVDSLQAEITKLKGA